MHDAASSQLHVSGHAIAGGGVLVIAVKGVLVVTGGGLGHTAAGEVQDALLLAVVQEVIKRPDVPRLPCFPIEYYSPTGQRPEKKSICWDFR